MSSTLRRRRLAARAILVALSAGVIASMAASSGPVLADDGDAEQQLAERFAPVVVVREQSEDCDTDGEPFEPAPVEIVLDNPEIFLRQVGNGDPVKMSAPGPSDLFDLREGWYLDFPGDALEPGCIFEQDFRRFSDGRSVVYAHVAHEEDRPGELALQYWFFWYHNPAKNDHEGDWEFIQLVFDVGTAEEALGVDPVSVGYAQHTGGERSDWDDAKLERDGDRPIVYAAKGSHASYFGQALYLGRSGTEGFGCDNTDAPSRSLDPDIVLLPDQVTDRDDPLAWLAFQGRWGQRETGFFNGPTGPYAKDRWAEPISWADDLRDSSVVIPAGDRFGSDVIASFCGTVEFGSTLLVTGLRNPLTLIVMFVGLALVVIAFSRRTRWSPVTTSPVRATRASGQILRCALRVWRDHPIAMLSIGLIYIPVSLATALVQAVILNLPLVDDLVDLAGARSGIALLFAVFVGGIGNLLAFAFVSMVVASAIDEPSVPGDRIPRSAWSADSLRRLVGAVARSAVIVTALLISVVGIPWGIRQLVRYQVVPQVVALEASGSKAALRRSSNLVRGHWWWTAGIITIVQMAVAAVGVGTALILLVTVQAIPLWLFNVISSAIYVALVPVGAAAMAYVYGSLSTRSTDVDPEDSAGDASARTPVRT